MGHDYWIPYNLRASSSAFAWGQQVFTDFNTGCLRKILLQSLQVTETVASKYGKLGAENEERHAKRLFESVQLGSYERERSFSRPIDHKVTLSGHIDFVIKDATDHAVRIDELKSVQSPNQYRQIVKHGKYKLENLAQTVAYMGESRVQHGHLIYTYYKEGAGGSPTDERIFDVAIDRFGRIGVDSQPTQFHYQDVLAHQAAAAHVIAKKEIGPRPFDGERLFTGACGYCAFKGACDRYDSGTVRGLEAFVDLAREGVMQKMQRSAV